MSDDNQTNTSAPQVAKTEYSTPSAYVDPDLPLNPTPIEEPVMETLATSEASATSEAPEAEAVAPELTTEPESPEEAPVETPISTDGTPSNVAEQVKNADSILIALSNNPSVDELASAIGLSLFLGRLDKHATSIYSGKTPNALEFLKPEQTFESSSDMLQDFVITISKDKADHLRYKLDGDFVKIFITPYKNRISAEDLEFSYGDFNVDLILALNVQDENSLDSALREHGRILHDATVINISNTAPGNFGKIEWSDSLASSVSEMLANLIFDNFKDTKLDAEEATAFLTGIVAATDRFASNTKPATMQAASELIAAGADPQLAANSAAGKEAAEASVETPVSASEAAVTAPETPAPAPETPAPAPAEEPSPILETLAELTENPVSAENPTTPVETLVESPAPMVGNTIAPPTVNPTEKYSQMLDEALAEGSPAPAAPMESALPPVNPAASSAPAIESAPELSNIPDINFGQTTSDVLPPPPAPPIDMNTPLPVPTELSAMPPTDLSQAAPASGAPETPAVPVTPEVPVAPEAPVVPETPPAPDAFTIPGI